MTDGKVLTIQDISCYGQCSLTVALPIISACGVETAILPSAVLSTHTGGFQGFTFADLTEELPKIAEHWQKEGIAYECIYTGYLGSLRQIDIVKDLFRTVLRPEGLKVVDPAMADHGRLYTGFDTAFAKAMAGLCGEADIILPNITEACFMTDAEYREIHDEAYIAMLSGKLRDLGVKHFVLKGIDFGDGRIGISVDGQMYAREKIEKSKHGTGDCFAAAFVGGVMQGKTLFAAARLATDFVVECLKVTDQDEQHWYGVKFERVLPMLTEELNG